MLYDGGKKIGDQDGLFVLFVRIPRCLFWKKRGDIVYSGKMHESTTVMDRL